jgi:hypothetical protein
MLPKVLVIPAKAGIQTKYKVFVSHFFSDLSFSHNLSSVGTLFFSFPIHSKLHLMNINFFSEWGKHKTPPSPFRRGDGGEILSASILFIFIIWNNFCKIFFLSLPLSLLTLNRKREKI